MRWSTARREPVSFPWASTMTEEVTIPLAGVLAWHDVRRMCAIDHGSLSDTAGSAICLAPSSDICRAGLWL